MIGHRCEIEATAGPARGSLVGGGWRLLVRVRVFDGPDCLDRLPAAYCDLSPADARELAFGFVGGGRGCRAAKPQGWFGPLVMSATHCGWCWWEPGRLRGVVSSWAGAIIRARRTPRRSIVQLRLELAQSPAPAAALWELVDEAQRRAAIALLAALIAQTIAGEADEEVAVGD